MKATIIHNVYLTHKNGLNTVLGLLLKNKNIFLITALNYALSLLMTKV